MSDTSLGGSLEGPHSPPGKVESEPTWREVLQFVRDQSKEETRSIDRLFDRALKYFGWLILATAVIASFFGFSTYTSLRDQVTTAANAEVKKAIAAANAEATNAIAKANHAMSEEIARISQRQNLELLVTEVLKKKTETELQKLTATKVEMRLKEMLPIIIDNAKAEARTQLAERFADRRISGELESSIVQAISPFKGTRYDIDYRDEDKEAYRFASRVEDILKRAGWKSGDYDVRHNALRVGYENERSAEHLDASWPPPGMVVLVKDTPAGHALKRAFASLLTSSTDNLKLRQMTIPARDPAEDVEAWLLIGPKN